MKKHLFYTFLLVFIATAIVTLLGVANILEVKEKYLTLLVSALLIELVGAVIGIYRGTDFFEEDSSELKEEKAEHTYISSSNSKTKVKPTLESKKPEETPIDIDSLYEKPENISLDEYLIAYIQLENRFREQERFVSFMNNIKVTWRGKVKSVSSLGDHSLSISINPITDGIHYSARVVMDISFEADVFSLHAGDTIEIVGILDLSIPNWPTVKGEALKAINIS